MAGTRKTPPEPDNTGEVAGGAVVEGHAVVEPLGPPEPAVAGAHGYTDDVDELELVALRARVVDLEARVTDAATRMLFHAERGGRTVGPTGAMFADIARALMGPEPLEADPMLEP